jgi:hypothetical protein
MPALSAGDAIHLADAALHKDGRHQAAHAVAQEDQGARPWLGDVAACVVQHLVQVFQQGVVIGQRALCAARVAVASLVVGTHTKAPVVEATRHGVVAPGVFAQAVHDEHHAARSPAHRQRPVVQGQVEAVAQGEGSLGRVGHVGTGEAVKRDLLRACGQ